MKIATCLTWSIANGFFEEYAYFGSLCLWEVINPPMDKTRTKVKIKNPCPWVHEVFFF